MNLLNNLFHIRELQADHQEIRTTLTVNAEHGILKGHFPDFPVMPGVCMMQVTREVFEKAVGISVRIRKGDNIKFLTVLVPSQHPVVKLTIHFVAHDGEYNISAQMDSNPAHGEPVTFFKFKGVYGEERILPA